jgi:hypothetical protein
VGLAPRAGGQLRHPAGRGPAGGDHGHHRPRLSPPSSAPRSCTSPARSPP